MAEPKKKSDCFYSPSLNQKGFTLIDLMVSVVIIGILSAIVLPSYRGYVNKASRAEVKTILMENAQFLERNYSLANQYQLDSNSAVVILPYQQSPKTGDAKYVVAAQYPDDGSCLGGQCYTLTATPVGMMADDACGTYTLTHSGSKGNIGMKPGMKTEDCWQH